MEVVKVLGNITIGAKTQKLVQIQLLFCDVPDNSTTVGVPAKLSKRIIKTVNCTR